MMEKFRKSGAGTSYTRIKAESGFTLIELAAVILIIGLLSVPLLQMYGLYQYQKDVKKTKDNIETAKSALSLFPIRYPCPSDRSLDPSDPEYGVEKCSTTVPPCIATCPPPPATCGFTTTQGICKRTTGFDRDGDGNPDEVYVGGLPYMYYDSAFTPTWDPVSTGAKEPIKGMGGAGSILDGWNNKITYVVSANLMNPNRTTTRNDFKLGVVSAINEHGAPTAGVNDDAQFAIISHGKNGNGAFVINGNHVGDGCISGMLETSNCKYDDSVFVQALGSYEGTTADYYDDITYFYLKAPGELWAYTTDSSGKPFTHINNRNTDFVGVNITTPSAKLDVNGTLEATTIRSDTVCDSTGAACFNPSSDLGNVPVRTSPTGTTSTSATGRCPGGRVAVGIKDKSIVCDFVKIVPNTGPVTCGVGFVKSILTNGCIICTDGTTTTEECP